MVFSSDNGFQCVILLSEAQHTIKNEISMHHPNETGGILIGKYDDNLKVAIVYLATRSSFDSIHKAASFQRSSTDILSNINVAKELYSSSLHYLGEWHSHPNNNFNPSQTDLKQMQSFAKIKQLGISAPLLLIVGGSHSRGLEWQFSLHRFKKPTIYLSTLD